MDLALVGNGSFQALIDSSARLQWLCWPRFDSSFVFGGLLDDELGGEFSAVPVAEGFEQRQRYLGNSAVVETTFSRPKERFTVTDFAPRCGDRRPRRLIRKVEALAGQPSVRIGVRPVYQYGLGEAAEVTFQSSRDCGHEQVIELQAPLYLVLSWNDPISGDLAAACERHLAETRDYWRRWSGSLVLPSCFRDEVVRSAITLKLHQYEDTGAFTAASTTSIPEHAGSGRNWDYRFCWPRDGYFTADALHALGRRDESEAFAGYLQKVAEKGPLQPLYGIGGESELDEHILEHLAGYRGDGPVRIGNLAYLQQQHDIYGEMIAAGLLP